jgi:hypothetical protein
MNVNEIIADCIKDLVRGSKRVDKTFPQVTIKSYYVGEIIRIDIKVDSKHTLYSDGDLLTNA